MNKTIDTWCTMYFGPLEVSDVTIGELDNQSSCTYRQQTIQVVCLFTSFVTALEMTFGFVIGAIGCDPFATFMSKVAFYLDVDWFTVCTCNSEFIFAIEDSLYLKLALSGSLWTCTCNAFQYNVRFRVKEYQHVWCVYVKHPTTSVDKIS